MAGVTGHRGITTGLFQMLLAQEKAIKVEVVMAAHEAANAGKKAAELTIDTTESSLRPGKDNRNWTFNMRDSLDRDVKRNGNTVSIRVGWINNKEGYFLKQEYGGPFNGTTITPMHALINAHDAITATLETWGIKAK